MLERTEPPSVENLTEARRAIEAMLLVSNDPTPVQLLAQLVELPVDLVQSMCRELAGEYEAERRGFELVEVAGGWRYQTHPDTHAYVERFALEGIPNRLSSAALETLAIVAYKQPISRAQIGAIRGVNVDGVLRTLVQRGYVDEKGRDAGPGQATLFGTTPFFLEQLGLMALDDLPPLGDFVPSVEVLEALENTLRVDPEPEITIIDDADQGDQPDGAPESPTEPTHGTTNGAAAERPEPAEAPGQIGETPEQAGEAGDEAEPPSPGPAESNGAGSVSANGASTGSTNGSSAAPTEGAAVEPVEGHTDEEPVYEVLGDPSDSIIALDTHLARSSTPDDAAEPEPEILAEPQPDVGQGSDPAGSTLEAADDDRSAETTDRTEPDEMPEDELEVAADPEVEMTDGPTATGAAGVDDARFPGPRSAPPTDASLDLEPGEGQDDDLDRRWSATAEGPGQARVPPFGSASPSTPETLSNGHRVDPDDGDA